MNIKRIAVTVGAVAAVIGAVLMPSGVAHASTQTCTWTGAGADKNWSTAQNWTCTDGTVPDNGAKLVFPKSAGEVSSGVNPTPGQANNDLSVSYVYSGITFQDDTIADNTDKRITITGNDIKLAGDIIQKDPTSHNLVDIKTTVTMITDGTISGKGISNLNIDVNNHTVNVADKAGISPIGNGNIVVNNGYIGKSDQGSFTGYISSTGNNTTIGISIQALSADSHPAGITVGEGTSLQMCSDRAYDVKSPITLVGAGNANFFGSTNKAKIWINICKGAGFGEDTEVYHGGSRSIEGSVVLSGGLTIRDADVSINASDQDVEITGTIDAVGRSIKTIPGMGGDLKINATSNNSNTPNGTYVAPRLFAELTNSNNKKLSIGGKYDVCLNGATRMDAGVYGTGKLCGNGQVGNISLGSKGVISPQGILRSGNIEVNQYLSVKEGIFEIAINGQDVSQSGQLQVTGAVNLEGISLRLSVGQSFQPSVGQAFTIIDNDGVDAIVGTFKDLPQGATVTVGDYEFTISYTGGDGNDVVLTVKTTPGTPNTAGILAQPANGVLAAAVIVIGMAVFVLYSRSRRPSRR